MKYVAFVVFIWVVGAIMGSLLDNAFLTTSDNATLNTFMQAEQVHMPVSGGEDVNVLKAKAELFPTIWNAAMFNFKFLHGGWAILKWIVFGPLAAMMLYAMIMTFINLLQKSF